MKTALIIGGGFAGCAAAHQLSLLGGWDVHLVEKASYLGGGVKTHWYGGHPFTYGPRHFLTQKEYLFDYLNKLVPMWRCKEHEFITYIEKDEQFYNFPMHRDDIARMPDKDKINEELNELRGAEHASNLEEYWIYSVGQTLYDKFVDNYSKKMWLIDDNKKFDTFDWSPKGVTLKEGPRAAWDTAISAYPIAPNGYDDYFDIATADTNVHLNTVIEQYDLPNKTVVIGGEKKSYDLIVNTASPDDVMGHAYGELNYVGREFMKIVLPVEHAFPENVYFVYYASDEPFTRIVEYKKFTNHKSPSTFLGIEIPSNTNKLYPYPITYEVAKAQEYFEALPEGVVSMGRAGSYKYIDIDDIIDQAMDMARQLKAGGMDHPVPLYGDWLRSARMQMEQQANVA